MNYNEFIRKLKNKLSADYENSYKVSDRETFNKWQYIRYISSLDITSDEMNELLKTI